METMDNPKYLDLMTKYLSGNINPTERQDLLVWAESAEDNKIFFDEMIQLWSLSDAYEEEDFYPVNVEAAWDQLAPRLDANTRKEEEIEIPPNQAEEEQQEPSASPGRIIPFYYRKKTWSIAAAIALILSVGAFLFPQLTQSPMATIVSLEGERKNVLLPDGSKIVLNANSKLSYPRKFKVRNVELEGEAYFDVASMKDRPFTILSGDLITTVVGTAFNIRAYPEEEEVEVTVEEGIVRVEAPEAIIKTEATSNDPNEISAPVVLTLLEGQSAIYDQEEKALAASDLEVTIANAWKDRMLGFDDLPLPKVAQRLENYFGIKILLDQEKYKGCLVLIPATKDPVLDEMLEIVETMMPGLTIKSEGNRNYRVEGGENCE